ncbi:MAG: hypothetical protein ACKVP2_02725 [Burkholderiales bacterium]
MLPRLNFLLGLGILILLAFYLLGRYLVIAPLISLLPSVAKPIAGLLVLAAVGLTVQFLAMAMGKLSGVASYGNAQAPGRLTLISQVSLLCGHVGMFYAAIRLFHDERPVSVAQILIAATLYGTGVVLAIHEWRQRPGQTTA